jgi:hypothetical protein
VRPYLEKPFTKIGLVEWLKGKALSSRPRTKKKKKPKNTPQKPALEIPGRFCGRWTSCPRKCVVILDK